MTFQIHDWNKNFENNRSRTIEQLDWVAVPNKQHGMGLSRILAEPDGAAIYGIWHLIVGTCSQQKLPREGWLTDDGTKNGDSFTSDDLALKIRRPEKEIARALEVLTSHRIGWIDVIDSSHVDATLRHADAAELPLDGTSGRKGVYARANERTNERTKTDAQRDAALRVLGGMNGHREIVPRGFSKSEANLKEILARLEAGNTEADLLLIVEHKATEMKRDPSKRVYFTPTCLFRPRNFDRNLNMAEVYAAHGGNGSGPGASAPVELDADQKFRVSKMRSRVEKLQDDVKTEDRRRESGLRDAP